MVSNKNKKNGKSHFRRAEWMMKDTSLVIRASWGFFSNWLNHDKIFDFIYRVMQCHVSGAIAFGSQIVRKGKTSDSCYCSPDNHTGSCHSLEDRKALNMYFEVDFRLLLRRSCWFATRNAHLQALFLIWSSSLRWEDCHYLPDVVDRYGHT